FEQKGFQMLQKLEAVLMSVHGPEVSEEIKNVVCFDDSDLQHHDRLHAQLLVLHSGRSLPDLQSVVTYLKSLTEAEKTYFSEVVKLILGMPATNATSEKSFSALRRVKTWLCTMCQNRLNWCMLLHVHKCTTDALSMQEMVNDF
ncbi:hypothetical protein ScPMuIL_005158, partial [Solemya velum]